MRPHGVPRTPDFPLQERPIIPNPVWKKLGKHAQAGQGTLGHYVAVRCAAKVFAACDRRAPEAVALAAWLAQCGGSLGVHADDLPDDDLFGRRRDRQVIPPPVWLALGETLAAALDDLPPVPDAPGALWVGAFAQALGLDALETRILELAVAYSADQRVARLCDMVSEARGGPSRLQHDPVLIGLLLGAEPAAVEARLGMDGPLLTGGLLRLDMDGDLMVFGRFAALARGSAPPGNDLFERLLGPAIPPTLPWDAFAHLRQQAVVAADVLRAALAGREAGIHLLLYGPPGTGKTSFAATLAGHVGAQLRPVAEHDAHGGEPNRGERLSALRMGARLAPRNEVLLFDEAEDLFLHSAQAGDGPTASRVYMHRFLERSAAPVIWTANGIGALGPAVLRRMTLCLELKVPDVATRTRLWRGLAGAESVALADAEAADLARLVPVAPALAASALRAARLAGGGAQTVRVAVEGVMRAMTGGPLPPAPDMGGAYDPALVNADQDLAALAAGLLRPGAARAVSFLLSGPPGTGKSAWVRHLAAQLGLEVLQKRGSDLFDRFVGGTEARIAAAFAEAREAGAFLVFDEADSLLAERGDAVRNWEVSQVNEMLTWMEAHPLPFACTTNLADRLDRASLRRFLVKVRFGWMDAGQARRAFERFFGMVPPAGLDVLTTLTPADFTLVLRRVAVTGEGADATALVRTLAAECEGRFAGRSRMGFRICRADG